MDTGSCDCNNFNNLQDAAAVPQRRLYWLVWIIFGIFLTMLFISRIFSYPENRYLPPPFEKLHRIHGILSFAGSTSYDSALVIKVDGNTSVQLSGTRLDGGLSCRLVPVDSKESKGRESALRASLQGKKVVAWWHSAPDVQTDGLLYELQTDDKKIVTYYDMVKRYQKEETSWPFLLIASVICMGITGVALWRFRQKGPLIAPCKLPPGIHLDQEKRLVRFVALNAKSTKRALVLSFPVLLFCSFLFLHLSLQDDGLSFLKTLFCCFFAISWLQGIFFFYLFSRSEVVTVDAASGKVKNENILRIETKSLGILKRMNIGYNDEFFDRVNLRRLTVWLKGKEGEYPLPHFCLTKKALKKAIKPVSYFLQIPAYEKKSNGEDKLVKFD